MDAPGFAWEYLRRNPDFLRDHRKLRKATIAAAVWTQARSERSPAAGVFAFANMALLANRSPTALGPPRLAKRRCPDLAAAGLSLIHNSRLLSCHSGLGTIRDGPGNVGRHHRCHGPATHGLCRRSTHRPCCCRSTCCSSNVPAQRSAYGVSCWGDRRVQTQQHCRKRARIGSFSRCARSTAVSRGKLPRDRRRCCSAHPRVSGRAWKTHDLRDRTIRLVRFGFDMMRGGYRSLLLHPYRRRK